MSNEYKKPVFDVVSSFYGRHTRFTDIAGQRCLIATETTSLEDKRRKFWIGFDVSGGDGVVLNQEMAAELLPLLKRFVDRGDI